MPTQYHGIQTQTKIYIDGFRVDTIQTPKLCDNLEEVALTPKVREALEGKEVAKLVPVPRHSPRFILITTEL